MTRTLVITNRAEEDLIDIWLWTRENFGEPQADRYLDALDTGLRRCGAEPAIGQNRSQIRPGYRSYRIGKHAAFYTHSDTHVVIQRVLHASMDFGTHLPESGSGDR